jgi:hypothetical protein
MVIFLTGRVSPRSEPPPFRAGEASQFNDDYFLTFLLNPIGPITPEPSRSIVEGKGA